MATGVADDFSLLGLEDELSCSICLSPFECPVTIPCGHNFCQDCLLATWKDSYVCPQCRTAFAARPELKKNTVLSAVVETFKARSGGAEAAPGPGKEEEEAAAVRCDACMEAEAAQTCLTCMASFCEEHLRPHRDNPVFRPHRLIEPVGDLAERICPEHHKLMELFCSQHDCSICTFCLQHKHKGCCFTSQEEQRSRKEAFLRGQLGFLDGKIAKNENILSEMKDLQNKLKDSAAGRKKLVSADYQQMRELLAREERDALSALDREVDTGLTKIRGLSKKFSENVLNMSRAKDDIRGLLAESQNLLFLQTSYTLPQAATFDPYTPRINLDSKKVIGSQAFAVALKEHLAELLKQPLEARLPLIKAGERGASPSGSVSPGAHKDSGPFRGPRSQSPVSQSKPGQKKKPSKQPKKDENVDDAGMGQRRNSMDLLVEFGREKTGSRCEANNNAEMMDFPSDIGGVEKRSDLLKYGSVLTLDPRTAHKRIALSEGFTKASVSEEQSVYPDCPERFSVCSQVLASKGFTRGRHYWEVRLSGNNFVGVGLAYGSIDRKGPASRLGRNERSWCVEWFNVKLSAWHNSCETLLTNPSPKRVGVLLDCEAGAATFYNVADRAYPFHTFVFPFAEAVHPAFWIFSSGSSVSLCKLQA